MTRGAPSLCRHELLRLFAVEFLTQFEFPQLGYPRCFFLSFFFLFNLFSFWWLFLWCAGPFNPLVSFILLFIITSLWIRAAVIYRLPRVWVKVHLMFGSVALFPLGSWFRSPDQVDLPRIW